MFVVKFHDPSSQLLPHFCFVSLLVSLSSLFLPCLTLSGIPRKEEECGTGEAESLLQRQGGDGVAMGRDSQSCPVEADTSRPSHG